ncbi:MULTISPECIES: helix-turn-helix domain-containing protein [Flavobacteriaceae]|uniref:XRE family transcriptional regulator n=2 Tax=Flavobacteriaceae TaxID=49546 RepID=A0A4Y8AXE4_9FLAO|nr:MULTISPECIES: helix-turn-helix transcriptional regulator [Flavobacteriaceae]TEW76712.1 XRE family transcriptional regulator [Gramella jeungdoensis]GGK50680.1 transcriptional regulator [Lutibacter litoralis]
MINVEEFAKRLNIIMDFYQLSAASLADKIEVQRSSISHLLSGRNKPSLEFVLKILKTFPEVELYWLLNGVGNFPKTTTTKSNQDTPTLFSIEKNNTIEKTAPIKTTEENNTEIERIVIFFKDGSFKNYSS